MDQELAARLARLAEAIRHMPRGNPHRLVVDAFLAVVQWLEDASLIDRAEWDLAARGVRR